ncbi:amidohydrolase family protein [bacterium]|nr:amidohydrolase family protein [bacterium]
MNRKSWLWRGCVAIAVAVAIAVFSPAGMTQAPSRVLFENVRIFDGTSSELSDPSYVLVEDNKIQTISSEPIAVTAIGNLTVIDGQGRTLMPGLTDAHYHFNTAITSVEELLDPNISNQAARDLAYQNSVVTAENLLMYGFTTARDVGGNVFDLKRAIDAGDLVGPRIYPSGAHISQTSGHTDFRTVDDLPWTPTSPPSRGDILGENRLADGVPEMLRAVREQLMRGASQIKISTGGGVSSNFDPLDVSQYTEEEIRAAVNAAADWNTYVTVHAFTPRSIQRSIRAGVKCIEHGFLIDEETAQLMAEQGTWLSIQPILDDEDAIFPEGSPEPQRGKFLQVTEGTDTAYGLAKQYDIKTAFGTDTLFDPELATRQGAQLAKLVRWYEPWEVLKIATHDNHELFTMSGPRNPYPGTLGVVKEGALADLLLVNGNPLENIELIADPENNFVVIMKDGVIYKDTVS